MMELKILFSQLDQKKFESFIQIGMKVSSETGCCFQEKPILPFQNAAGSWAFYLQADEVIHESEYSRIRQLMKEHLHNPQILGFTFRYLHFYGDYWTTNPWGFHRAVRLIRNNGEVASCGDAVGFLFKR